MANNHNNDDNDAASQVSRRESRVRVELFASKLKVNMGHGSFLGDVNVACVSLSHSVPYSLSVCHATNGLRRM